jgi:hypothetical protein
MPSKQKTSAPQRRNTRQRATAVVTDKDGTPSTAVKGGQTRGRKRKTPAEPGESVVARNLSPSPSPSLTQPSKRAKTAKEAPPPRKKLPPRQNRNENPAARQHEYERAKPGERAAEKAAEQAAKAEKQAKLRAELEQRIRELEEIDAMEDEEVAKIGKAYHRLSSAKRKRLEEAGSDDDADDADYIDDENGSNFDEGATLGSIESISAIQTVS